MVIVLLEEKGGVGLFEMAAVRIEGIFSFLEVEEKIMLNFVAMVVLYNVQFVLVKIKYKLYL